MGGKLDICHFLINNQNLLWTEKIKKIMHFQKLKKMAQNDLPTRGINDKFTFQQPSFKKLIFHKNGGQHLHCSIFFVPFMMKIFLYGLQIIFIMKYTWFFGPEMVNSMNNCFHKRWPLKSTFIICTLSWGSQFFEVFGSNFLFLILYQLR